MNLKIGILLLISISITNTKNNTIAIIGTNDIHGAALPTKMYRNYQN